MDIAVKLDFDSCDDDDSDVSYSIPSGCDSEHYNQESVSVQSYRSSNSHKKIFSPSKKSRAILLTNNRENSEDSPPYKKIRALRLFDSPATPKTLLEKSAPNEENFLHNSNTSNKCPSVTRPSTRSRLFNLPRNSTIYESPNLNEQYSRISIQSHNLVSTPPGLPQFSNTEPDTTTPQSNQDERPSANVNPFTPTGMLMSSKKRTRSRREHDDINAMSCEPINTTDGSHSTNLELAYEEEIYTDFLDPMQEDEQDQVPTKRLTMHEANVSRYHQEFIELDLIGQGEFGGVYRVRHRLDGCVYAIKKSLKPVAGSINERIALNEVYAHAVLGKHPHVVRYYSAWAENNHMIIQNEFCNCGSLADIITKTKNHNRSISEQRLKQILFHIAKGLRYIHSLNLVHMDIKPGNIFISREQKVNYPGDDSADDGFEDEQEEEEEITYKIGDLGHVTSIVNPQVEEGDCRYLPREILQDDFTQLPKADIFALGLTLYEAASGKELPRNGNEWHDIRNGNLDSLQSYSPDFQLLLTQMVHSEPSMRPSAAQLVNHPFLCPTVKSSNAQLRLELHNEKLKNEMLTKKLEEAERIQKISLASLQSTARTRAQRAAAHLQAQKGEPRVTRNSNNRLIGRKMNRSMSTF